MLIGLTAIAAVGGAPPRDATWPQAVRREFTELHMGMAVRIVLHAPDDNAAREAARAAFARIAALEDVMSDYRPSSELRRFATSLPGRDVALSADLCEVLDLALRIARASNGFYDPTVGPYVSLWRRARRDGRLPPTADIVEAQSRVGWWLIALDERRCMAALQVAGMEIDLGGIAKGFILDQALVSLRRRGVASALIEAGGDIVVGEAPPGRSGWSIAVPHADSVLVARAASLANAAISTSGDTEQSVEIDGQRYSHVVDPRTGLGSTRGVLVTVIAPRGAVADALATAVAAGDPGLQSALIATYPGVIIASRGSAALR